jgi:hypothetical protein
VHSLACVLTLRGAMPCETARTNFFGKLWRADVGEWRSAMDLSEPRRRTLAFWSLGLVLLALMGSVAALLFVDGYALDWPLMGLTTATVASMGAVLIKPTRPRLRVALNGIAVALTFPFAAWVLWRIFV